MRTRASYSASRSRGVAASASVNWKPSRRLVSYIVCCCHKLSCGWCIGRGISPRHQTETTARRRGRFKRLLGHGGRLFVTCAIGRAQIETTRSTCSGASRWNQVDPLVAPGARASIGAFPGRSAVYVLLRFMPATSRRNALYRQRDLSTLSASERGSQARRSACTLCWRSKLHLLGELH